MFWSHCPTFLPRFLVYSITCLYWFSTLQWIAKLNNCLKLFLTNACGANTFLYCTNSRSGKIQITLSDRSNNCKFFGNKTLVFLLGLFWFGLHMVMFWCYSWLCTLSKQSWWCLWGAYGIMRIYRTWFDRVQGKSSALPAVLSSSPQALKSWQIFRLLLCTRI